MAAVGATTAEPVAAILDLLERGGFIAAFFTALSVLRDASETSPRIKRCGRFLAAQPPGSRYAALTAGGHVIGLALNFGVIVMLGAMVAARKRVRSAEDRLRRDLVAVLRGYASILAWSPLTLSTAVTLSLVPRLDYADFALYGLALGVALAALGWALERRSAPGPSETEATSGANARAWNAVLPVLVPVALVALGAAAVSQLGDTSVALGVMAATPFVAAAWIIIQHRRRPVRTALALCERRLKRYLSVRLFGARNETALLWSAAVLGFAGAALLRQVSPIEAAPAQAFIAGAPWVLPIVAASAMVLAGQLGMNPLLAASLLGGVTTDFGALGVAPVAMAVAITGGWAIAATSSPYAASTMLTGRIAGVSAIAVGLRWNGRYMAASLILVSAYAAGLALIL